jgi:orotidine-5'-phosphate decarboxylase
MTTTTSSFRARFEAKAVANHSLLCVGLDPDPARIPAGLSTRDFLLGIVEATADVACCYKPNIAFFEPDLAEGMATLKDVIDAIHAHDLPVILDAKRGDIGNTAAAYARAAFESLEADAITLSPYLGLDSLEPFLAYEDKTAFLLCRTTNPGAGDLQDLLIGEAAGAPMEPLYARVARLANTWNTRGNVGLVVGATYPREAAEIRAISPDLPFLMPGVGAQQAEIDEAVQGAMDRSRAGIIVNASRAVLYPAAPDGKWADASRKAAEDLRDAINTARGA